MGIVQSAEHQADNQANQYDPGCRPDNHSAAKPRTSGRNSHAFPLLASRASARRDAACHIVEISFDECMARFPFLWSLACGVSQ
jgi:hypothetical protein